MKATKLRLPILPGLSLLIAAATFLPVHFYAAAKGGQPGPDQAKSCPATDYLELTFPQGTAIAQITWAAPAKLSSGNGRCGINRALATGLVRVPKNGNIWLKLKFDGLEHMDTLDQFAQCPVLSFSATKLDFTDEHISHLKNFAHLINLDLSETLISDKSLKVIGTFTSLKSLSLSRTDITGAAFESLANLHGLTLLNLTGIDLKRGCLGKLKPILSGLQKLDLTGVGLTKEDGPTLQSLSNVTTLDITNNKDWDDNCAQYLTRLNKLQELSISGTKMTDKSLPALSSLPNLKTIVVRPNSFWTPGIPQKARAGLQIKDIASKGNATPDLFNPLH
jgi:hypothetical protein